MEPRFISLDEIATQSKIDIDTFFGWMTWPVLYYENAFHYVDKDRSVKPVRSLHQALGLSDHTIKMTSLEKMNPALAKESRLLAEYMRHEGPVTCHAFYSKPNSYAFGSHDDYYDVLLRVVEGVKTMSVEGKIYRITPEDGYFLIPDGCYHHATNEEESLMLSFGMETFLEDRSTCM